MAASFESGRAFYDKKMRNSKQTEQLYALRLCEYCYNVNKTPDELIQLKLEGLQNPATEKEFAAEELLESFLRRKTLYRLKNGKRVEVPFTDSSKISMLAAVKSFYDSTRGRSLAKDTGAFLEAPEAKKRTPAVEDCVKLEEAMKLLTETNFWFGSCSPLKCAKEHLDNLNSATSNH